MDCLVVNYWSQIFNWKISAKVILNECLVC